MDESPHKLLIITQEKITLVEKSGRHQHNQVNEVKIIMSSYTQKQKDRK